MLNTILVPLDGSVFAEQVLPLAVSIASRAGSRLVLVKAAPVPREPLQINEERLSVDEQLAWMTDSAERYLRKVREQVNESVHHTTAGQGGNHLEIATRVLVGDAGPTVADYARECGADLIVMATHGRSGFDRWSLGSVADKLVQLSRVPVIAVRPATTRLISLEALPSLDRILVTLDGSEMAEQVLPLAKALARGFDAELLLFRVAVIPPSVYHGPDVALVWTDLWEGIVREAGHYLEQVASTLRSEGFQVRAMTARDNVAESILVAADEQDVSLIAMTTHGRTGLARVVFGSVADRVLRAGNRPVLLVRPPEM
jgi:nucleotide-binding universal stress UspA family protein